MGKFVDLTDRQFDRLKVLEKDEPHYTSGGYKKTKWICRCDCGKIVSVVGASLLNGTTKSCGCLREENRKRNKGYHHRERLYVLWQGIRQRCNNPNNISYKWYGAKGIKVCEEWENDYIAFRKWAIESGYDETLPRGTQTIERLDVGKDYCPENCTWKTIKEQQRNKENTRLFEYNGETHTVGEWSEITGISQTVLHARIFSCGWDIKDAIERPLNKLHGKNYIYVNYFGEEKSLLEISKETGISYNALKDKYRKGLSIENEVMKYKENGNSFEKKYEFDGKKLTILEWSEELGVSKDCLRGRIKSGKPYEKVFTSERYIYSKRKNKKAED